MSAFYRNYHDAHEAAVALARRLNHVAQLRSVKEYGIRGFSVSVFCANDSHNVELVYPNDPLTVAQVNALDKIAKAAVVLPGIHGALEGR